MAPGDSVFQIGPLGSTMFSRVCVFGGGALAMGSFFNMGGLDPHTAGVTGALGVGAFAMGVASDAVTAGQPPLAKKK